MVTIFHTPLGFVRIKESNGMIIGVSFIDDYPVSIKKSGNALLKEAKKQILQYFNQERKEFDLPILYPEEKDFQKIIRSGIISEYGKNHFKSLLRGTLKEKISTNSLNKMIIHNPLHILLPLHRIWEENEEKSPNLTMSWRNAYLRAIEDGSVNSIGIHKDKVFLNKPSALWKKLFKIELRAIILSGIAPRERVHHIGSTAIDFIKAKPIIDILVGISPGQEEEVIKKLEMIGYIYKANFDPKEWHYLVKGNDSCITHHLHICYADSDFYHSHILFKDILNKNFDLAKRYEYIKTELSEKYKDHRQHYTKSKEDFIWEVLNK